MTESSSYRTIVRSSSIIGGAQVVNIVTGIVKMKTVALLLGPTGVGTIGLYVNLMQTASLIAGLGLNTAGTRQIAAAQSEGCKAAVGRTWRALFVISLLLAVAGGVLFWTLSGWIAQFVLQNSQLRSDVRWLSLGVALTVASGSQSALMTGLRRVGDLAWVTIGSGALGTLFGIGAIAILGTQGIVAMVIAAPLTTFFLGHVFVASRGKPKAQGNSLTDMAQTWKPMARLGFAFMISGLVAVLGQLVVRSIIQRELGTEALGHFQAAWIIGMTYLGFVLGAMGTDYYPRLSTAMRDSATAVQLVNEQTEVALLLCTPLLLLILSSSPWVLDLLYTEQFAPAEDILRWQLLGDIFKMMSWPLGFILLARGAGKAFVATETISTAIFVLGTWIGLPMFGVEAAGMAFLAMYLVHLPLVWWTGGRSIGFRWSQAVKTQTMFLIISAAIIEIACRWSDYFSLFFGIPIVLVSAIWSLKRLSALIGSETRLGRVMQYVLRPMSKLTFFSKE